MLNESDKKNYIKRYNERLNKFGYNSKTLGWKGGYRKQKKRFCELLKICAFSSKSVKSILDVGCGFGDLFRYISEHKINVNYHGVDINQALLDIGKKNHGEKLKVESLDILDPTPETVDALMKLDLASGVDVEIKL